MLPGQVLKDLVETGQLLADTTDPSGLDIQPASIDLHPAWVLAGGGEKPLDEHDLATGSFQLKSGQIVTLISREELTLPKFVCGILSAPNRRYAEQGILALNTGHIDPAYQGPINLRVVNLGARPFEITARIPFATLALLPLLDIRLAIGSQVKYPGPKPDYGAYKAQRGEVVKERGEAGYTPSEDTVERVLARLVTRRLPGAALLVLTMVAALLALVTVAFVTLELFQQAGEVVAK